MQRLASASLVCLLAACGDSGTSHHVDGGHDGSVDAGGDAAPGDASTDGGGADAGDGGGGDGSAGDGGPTCGSLRPDISGINGTEGLVIARDGTMYFSQDAHVGRMLPDGTTDLGFVSLTGATTVWGLALDAANTHLYAGSPSTHIVYAIDLTTTTPTVSTLVMSAGQPNGLTMGPDGAVYFTDFAGGTVKRSDPAVGGATTISMSTISGANGLTFDPHDPNTLYVLEYGGGHLYKLTLDPSDHHESARMAVGMGLFGSPDGITIDDAGRIYITNNAGGQVYRIDMDGTGGTTVMPGLSAPANLELGVGSLGCHDLYVANGGTLVRIDTMTATSAPFPWH